MVEIELLYFDGCPSWERAWAELGRALAASKTAAAIRLRNVETLPEAERHGFAGSPTLRIDGRDLEGYDGPAVLACRRYQSSGGRGWPSGEFLRQRLAAQEPA